MNNKSRNGEIKISPKHLYKTINLKKTLIGTKMFFSPWVRFEIMTRSIYFENYHT